MQFIKTFFGKMSFNKSPTRHHCILNSAFSSDLPRRRDPRGPGVHPRQARSSNRHSHGHLLLLTGTYLLLLKDTYLLLL